MRWTERQLAMLREMGIRLWPAGAGTGLAPSCEHDSLDHRLDMPQPDVLSSEPVSAQAAGTGRASMSREAMPPRVGPEMGRQAAGVTGDRRREAEGRVSGEPAPSAVRPDATEISRMDWLSLRSTVAACTACRLCEGRTQTVFGVGNPRAHWMIVGEAPGEQEDLAGEPFVGKSGQLLDNMLRSIRLTRQDADPEHQVYIANTIKCRPPGNRNPQPDELAKCEPFLIRQVELVQPRIILAMGRFAVQSLLRSSEPIGRLRGRVHDYHGVPLIVTYHPAYLLRSPEEKARAWDDLCLAVETVKACTSG